MTNISLRKGFLVLLTGLLLSCGGGGSGGGGGIAVLGSAATPGTTATTGSAGATGSDVTTGSAATPGSTSRTGLLADEGSPVGGAADGQGTSGSSGSSGASGGTATASGGNDGSGVGSGGTGVSTADAAGIGAVDGAGSIIVSGLRYNTDTAVVNLEDAAGLQLGMSVKVTGPVNADFTSGIARRIDSAADIRGPHSSVNLAQGNFVIMGTTVTTDQATVWADAAGLAAIAPNATLQVWGLPAAPGVLRATRVEQRGPAAPILTGTVENLDAARSTFKLGSFDVDYSGAVLSGSLDGRPLTDGTLVRVRANSALPGRLAATLVQWWYPVPTVNTTPVQLQGVVTDYAGLSSLRVLGTPVDASAAQVTGGPAGSIGNGVKVDVAGTMSSGVLKATKVKIRHVPGTGGPVSFNLIGNIGNFSSPSSFRVRGQPINAASPGVVFVNGSVSNLRNGVRISVEGSQVVDGVLIATRVVFE
ncbi:DUF5666 domain-containing protein [Variovorax guangxiensis]|uniref:DUF5666 domain-containing protein n=1 Tax=Variovorax guangxiensis TaxID=1775474 RepID=UPI00285EEA44|nr:DUF5666 domain-containing protein [Variovorax guangxiensis]MDR6860502.1 hypothetical protein [Variovorax guangxiensis]